MNHKKDWTDDTCIWFFSIYECCSICILIVSIHVCCWRMQHSNKIEMQSGYTVISLTALPPGWGLGQSAGSWGSPCEGGSWLVEHWPSWIQDHWQRSDVSSSSPELGHLPKKTLALKKIKKIIYNTFYKLDKKNFCTGPII